MERERALENGLEVLLHAALPDLQGKALQHLGEISELVQHHGDDQLGLVAEVVVQRALGDVRRLGDVARARPAQALRGQQLLRRGEEALPLVGRGRARWGAGRGGLGHASCVKEE